MALQRSGREEQAAPVAMRMAVGTRRLTTLARSKCSVTESSHSILGSGLGTQRVELGAARLGPFDGCLELRRLRRQRRLRCLRRLRRLHRGPVGGGRPLPVAVGL